MALLPSSVPEPQLKPRKCALCGSTREDTSAFTALLMFAEEMDLRSKLKAPDSKYLSLKCARKLRKLMQSYL